MLIEASILINNIEYGISDYLDTSLSPVVICYDLTNNINLGEYKIITGPDYNEYIRINNELVCIDDFSPYGPIEVAYYV